MKTLVNIAPFLAGAGTFLLVWALSLPRKEGRETTREHFVKRLWDPGKLDTLSKQLKAIGGVKIFGAAISSGTDFMVYRLTLMGAVVAIMAFLQLIESRPYLIPTGAAFAYFMPYMALREKLRKRADRIKSEMPAMIDMLGIAMEAGMTFDKAIRGIVQKTEGVVRDLFYDALIEIDRGALRKKDALMRAADTSLNEDMRILVKVICQAEEVGNPIRDVLLAQADSMRRKWKYEIQNKANKLSNTMFIPVMIFLVPPAGLLYLLPALINFQYIF